MASAPGALSEDEALKALQGGIGSINDALDKIAAQGGGRNPAPATIMVDDVIVATRDETTGEFVTAPGLAVVTEGTLVLEPTLEPVAPVEPVDVQPAEVEVEPATPEPAPAAASRKRKPSK